MVRAGAFPGAAGPRSRAYAALTLLALMEGGGAVAGLATAAGLPRAALEGVAAPLRLDDVTVN